MGGGYAKRAVLAKATHILLDDEVSDARGSEVGEDREVSRELGRGKEDDMAGELRGMGSWGRGGVSKGKGKRMGLKTNKATESQTKQETQKQAGEGEKEII